MLIESLISCRPKDRRDGDQSIKATQRVRRSEYIAHSTDSPCIDCCLYLIPRGKSYPDECGMPLNRWYHVNLILVQAHCLAGYRVLDAFDIARRERTEDARLDVVDKHAPYSLPHRQIVHLLGAGLHSKIYVIWSQGKHGFYGASGWMLFSAALPGKRKERERKGTKRKKAKTHHLQFPIGCSDSNSVKMMFKPLTGRLTKISTSISSIWNPRHYPMHILLIRIDP